MPVTDFLVAGTTRSAWAQRMVDDVIRPAQAANAAHPFFTALRQGALPREKVVRWAADMLWITVRFPEIIAGLASRCPAYDHGAKAVLVANAYEELGHPAMLARFLQASGADAGVLLDGPMEAYRPTRHSEAILDFLTAYAYHHPFVEGICAVGAMEAMTPRQVEIIHGALIERYGYSAGDLEWAGVHLGEVEQDHALAALVIADQYIGEDATLRGRCQHAVQRGVFLAGCFPEAMLRQGNGDVLVD